ncbi:hypothetical protein MKX03_017475 [Papaver bracteatum]|nr:hypothetical protein MKX03_017475 [Papaver bracteatum]
MASSSSIFVLSLFILLCSTQSSSGFDEITYSADGSKVSLAFYYESLCPYCSNFMVNYLPKIFSNGLIDIIDLKLVPYGNARITADNVITCQHGPNECVLNTVEACAMYVWPSLDKHFKFINCVETFVYKGQQSEWRSCFSKLGYEEKAVKDCYNSGLGKKLDLKYAKETNDLSPPHKYVPWVTVNKVPLYDDYENFQIYVCNAYKGTPPIACQGKQLEISTKAKSNQLVEVTYMDETSPATNIMSRVTKGRRQMKF